MRIIVAVFLMLTPISSGAEVLVGTIDGLRAGSGFIWGDGGEHDLRSMWSYFNGTENWIYATGSYSNCDIYYFAGLTILNPVSDASIFPYSSVNIRVPAGGAVFFRSGDGFYGAWVIDKFELSPDRRMYGTWYFQDDGTADFSSTMVTVESGSWGGVKSLFH